MKIKSPPKSPFHTSEAGSRRRLHSGRLSRRRVTARCTTDSAQACEDYLVEPRSHDPLAVSASVLADGFQEHRVGPATIVRNHEAVLRFTKEVFPQAKILVEEGSDPENGDDEYFVIDVTTPGDVADLVARHREWHRQLVMFTPETARYYRLTLGVP